MKLSPRHFHPSVDGRRGELSVGWGIRGSQRHVGAELEVCLFFTVIDLPL